MSKILKSFQENEAGIRRYLSRFLKNRQDIDDSLQETFLKGFAAETKTDILEPKAFLYRVAKNVALYEIRKKQKNHVGYIEDFGGSELLEDTEQPSVSEQIDGRRKLYILSRAVATLPPQCRRAFLMRRVDGLRYKQIANRMNISVSAVEKHVANAVIKCNEYLLQQGLEPSEFSPVNKTALTMALRPSKKAANER
ncbi:sigma-70 family RNA polymerase sigma factor [Hyphococcus sp. DH-69]|uniref:sigma-70 family RNA polymerase sigma factor n=1 Tax=Hyphococcus formosus TaxID=3143534 RepID=UPI00398B1B9A